MKRTLADGTEVSIRRIRPDDKPLLVEGLARLSPDSIYKRFLTYKEHFSQAELRYLTEVDDHDHVALVAFTADDPRRLAAVARFVRLAGDPETADVAVVVGDHLQGRGLGKVLALELADAARERGIRRFEATILGDNLPARRLMAAMAARLSVGYPGDGAVSLTAELPLAA